MKHIPTLIDAPDELSRAGVIGILAGARYKPIAVKGGWEAFVASGKPIPEIVILVLSGKIDLAAVVQKIGSVAERSKVVLLGDTSDTNLVRSALCAGGSAFLPCSVAADTLVQTLNLARDGKTVFPSQIVGEVFACNRELDSKPKLLNRSEALTERSERPGRLSAREIEILKRLVHGESNKQISRRLDISETTVKVHVKAILRKIRVCNRTQAAIWGLDNLPDALGPESNVRPNAATHPAFFSAPAYPVAASVG